MPGYLKIATMEYLKFSLKKLQNVCTILAGVGVCILAFIFIATFAINMGEKINIIYINASTQAQIFETDNRFLSIALDSSIIANSFEHFNINHPRLRNMMKALSPGYFRIGGTIADRLTFVQSLSRNLIKTSSIKYIFDGGQCSYDYTYCYDPKPHPNFTMNGHQWLELNTLAENTELDIIFDLNSLKRFDNGSWDYENALQLIQFSSIYNLNVNWQLGNEPNAYRHQFNYTVDPRQLGFDFSFLKSLLKNSEKYSKSLLVGPDITRPQVHHKESEIYLGNFLKTGSLAIDAITWHQYNFNGRTATLQDFLDPMNFDILKWQIIKIKEICLKYNKPIWLSETSSAYGGGAPNLSNRYVATFIWLDKLGLSAKLGISVVVRQSIYRGYYALINTDYTPAPDFWVSYLYKNLVGTKVIDCHTNSTSKVRLYCHCTKSSAQAVTVFGVNLNNHKEKIRIEGFLPITSVVYKDTKIGAYILTSNKLDSEKIYLNGRVLSLKDNDVPKLNPKIINVSPYVEMPPYSSAFWIIPSQHFSHIC